MKPADRIANIDCLSEMENRVFTKLFREKSHKTNPLQRMRTVGFLIFLGVAILHAQLSAQRSYVSHSVLATGTWQKLAVSQSGIHKIDGSWLQSTGLTTLPIASGTIRLFGNGGEFLGESNSAPYTDDLAEVAIEVFDGGDGQFNVGDYLLFYTTGPHSWTPDLLNQRFQFNKNLYSERSHYYLTIGGVGKRIPTVNATGNSGPIIDRFLDRQVYELDSVNLLASGKNWYGDELAQAPGKSLVKTVRFSFPNLIPASTVHLQSDVIARSTGSGSQFELLVNGQSVGLQSIPSIGSNLYDPYAIARSDGFTHPLSNPDLSVQYRYQPGAFGAQGWLDRLQVFAIRSLSMNGIRSLNFWDLATVGQSNVQFKIDASPADLLVWEVTHHNNVRRLNGSRSGSQYTIQVDATEWRNYIAFTGTDFPLPQSIGKLTNQDLHGLGPTDMVILTPNAWRNEADRLANLHRTRRSLRVQVISMEQVQEEFGGGSPDPSSIRNLMKMFYDRYRAQPADRPRYLLLLGAGSYDPKDRIRNNDRPIPTYQSKESLDPLATYCTDDYFGLLDDGENINNPAITNLLDVGIGRVPARSVSEVIAFVDKVEDYDDATARRSWRTWMSFVADDEDGNLHLQDAEGIAATANQIAPWLNQEKIYLDAFRQQAGAGGTRYPEANQALDRQLFKGNLIVNYSGHGGRTQLAEENLVDQASVESWNNESRLPLFVVATCDFAPYDDPAVRGLGEQILLRPKTGGIALMSTARPVFAFSNRILNENYIRTALQPDANGNYLSLGEAVQRSKNLTYQTSSDLINNRKFSLLGDPALTLGFPKYRVNTRRINGQSAGILDTIKAGETVRIEGEVTDLNGNRLSTFQGFVYPTVSDKFRRLSTLGNDPSSYPVPIDLPGATLFSGKSTVTNGSFQFEFTVPLDSDPVVGAGRISYYAHNDSIDAQGVFTGFRVGDRAGQITSDREGPGIKLWLNEEGFAEGGLTNSTPVLLAELTDSSGINTAGGIGHDLIATISTISTSSTLNPQPSTFLLNDFYQADADSYKKGRIRFPLPELEAGSYSLKLRAWDVFNNPSEKTLSFLVGEPGSLRIERVLNYPNPFTDQTRFWFEHNAPGQTLRISVEVMTLTGRVVRTLQSEGVADGNFSRELNWDGRDDQGDRLARGVYLYRLRVRANGKGEARYLGKLVIL